MLRRVGTGVATLAPYVLILGLWIYLALLDPIPFWQEQGDYSWYSLSQAFTFESDLAGYPAVNIGFTVHPGIPFGIASWLAFRLSTFGIFSGANRISYAMNHAEQYWLWAKAIALLLTFLGVYILRRFLGRNTAAFWTGFSLYFGIVPAVFNASFVQLTNESFCLPYVIGYYALVYKYFQASAQPSILRRKLFGREIFDTDILAFYAGAAAAFGMSIKIYYLAPAIGFAFGIFSAVICGAMTWRNLVRSYTIACAGFGVMGSIIFFLIMGYRVFGHWVLWNLSMLMHVDRYGAGQVGIASPTLMTAALAALSSGSQHRFEIAILSIFLAVLLVIAARFRSPSWRLQYLPFSAAISLGLLINLFGLLKHYAEHYALPVCATLACFLILFEQLPSRRAYLKAGAAISAIFFLMNVESYSSKHSIAVKQAEIMSRDVAAIETLPVKPGQKRVWGYNSPTQRAVMPLIDLFAGSSLVHHMVYKPDQVDVSPMDDREAADWKYIVFPKIYFPTRESIPRNYRGQFDFNVTKYRPRSSDQIQELSNFFVVTRADALLAR